MATHARITENKFISLQFLRKKSDEVDFLLVDKHGSFLQIAIMIFDGDGQAFSKFPKYKIAMSLQYLKKEVKNEVDFLHANKHQSFFL